MPRRSLARANLAGSILAFASLAGACAAPAATSSPTQPASPPASSTSDPSVSASPALSLPSAQSAPRAAAADVPTGCLGLDRNPCLGVRDVALSQLRPGSAEVAYVRVGGFGCSTDTACPPDLASRPEGQVVIEFVDGSLPLVVGIRAADARIEATVEAETFFVLVRPESGPVGGPIVATELGHCGVGSGIDVDGSFWNPVGVVDADHADYINAAPATFRLVTPGTAALETGGGLRLDLVRHPGPKQLELCD
jgi:hypothetical protein